MIILKEASIPWEWAELQRYNADAGKRLDKDVIKLFEPYKPTKPIAVYRGMGGNPVEAATILKKLKLLEMKIGAKGVYSTGKIQSWSLSQSIAEQFMGEHTIAGLSTSSLGILMKVEKLAPEDIAVAIAFLPQENVRKYLNYDQDEILTQPGTYKFEVVKFFGDWSVVDVNSEIKKLANYCQSKFGGTLGKTWNKVAGFSLKFDNIYKRPDKWSPSIEVSVDGSMNKINISFNYDSGTPRGIAFFKARYSSLNFKYEQKNEIVTILNSEEVKEKIGQFVHSLKLFYGKG